MKGLLLASCLFLFSVIYSKLFAQADSAADQLAKTMSWYGAKKATATLFVHFDKNVYTNNENVWFTAYLLKQRDSIKHHTLAVALVRNDDRSVLAQGKFVIENSLSFGNLFLPDSLPPGDYEFVCYTNVMVDDAPYGLFSQPVTIKSVKTDGFIANLSFEEVVKPGMDTARILIKAYTADVTLIKNTPVHYFLGDINKPVIKGIVKTNNYGEAKIHVPLSVITRDGNVLHTIINNGKEEKGFAIKLPVYKREPLVKCFPEGGYLVAGALNNVGWETIGPDGEPAAMQATLYKNSERVKTIYTESYGLGRFTLTPENGAIYSIRLLNGEGSDTTYLLPAVLPSGPIISIDKACAGDTLLVQVNNLIPGSRWEVMVHNYASTFLLATVAAKRSSTLIKIPLDDVPKGLNTFTLLDTTGKAHAERLFFAHFNKRSKVEIATDKKEYATRQKVTMHLTISNGLQQPERALVSVACAQNNRFEPQKYRDIETYVYLQNELEKFDYKKRLMDNDEENVSFVEKLLLVKGWSRYTWKELVATQPQDTIRKVHRLFYNGSVKLRKKELGKPVAMNVAELISSKLSYSTLLNTDSAGHFTIPFENLVTGAGNRVRLTVSNKIMDQYIMTVNDPFQQTSSRLSNSIPLGDYTPVSYAQSTQALVVKNEGAVKRLLDVTVKTRKDTYLFAGANACGDYVCMYNVLNCTNHPADQSRSPVVGRSYMSRYGGAGPGQMIVYTGCAALEREQKKEYQFEMDGIFRKKEFYVPDYAAFNPPDPEYISTIYWNHELITNEKGEATATFYTSDVPGKFRIVVQGIINNDVVYGEQLFTVIK